MAKIVIDNIEGGKANRYWQGFNLVTTNNLNDNRYASGAMNPFARKGFISAGSSTFTDLTNVSELTNGSNVLNFVTVDDGNVGGFGTSLYFAEGKKIHAADILNNTIISASEFPHTINPGAGTHSAHTAETTRDIFLYQINGAERLFYLYTDNTDGDMGSYDLVSSFTADDANEAVWSTATGGTVLGTQDMFSIVADNGFAYVCQANVIHKFDGTTNGGSAGTVSSNVLKFDATTQIIDGIDARGKIWLLTKEINTASTTIASSERKHQVIIWNRVSSSLKLDDAFPLNGVSKASSLIFFRGNIYLFTQSLEGIVQLRRFNGTSFSVEIELGDVSSNNIFPANRKAVFSNDNYLLWQDTDGSLNIWSPEIGLHQISTNTTDNTAGAIKMVTNDTIYVSYNNNSSVAKIGRITPFASTSNIGAADFRSMSYQIPFSRVTGVRLYFPALSSGPDFNLTLTTYKNNSATELNSVTINYQDKPDGVGDVGYHWIPLNHNQCYAFQIGLTFPTGATVANSMIPSRIEIEYEPTPQRK